ncbi:MAG: ATP-binding protein, partial [Beijerinckiaceae bacterium]
MDPRLNPYSPGAGAPPPELAGRTAVLEKTAIALDRIRAGRTAQSVILYGLRGVGKTVLLNRIRIDAEARGLESVRMEAPEEKSLPALLAPALRATLLRMSRMKAAKAAAERALAGLAGFIGVFKLSFGDLEVQLDTKPVRGLADSGDLESDLTDLMKQLGAAAKAADTAVVLYIDELQYVKEAELSALIMALHNMSQENIPVTMVAAGLPQLLGKMGRAKSYAERLFIFENVDRLDAVSAKQAIVVPARREGVEFTDPAINSIVEDTQGY